jgi:Phospholipase_D-nuclease N-terminal
LTRPSADAPGYDRPEAEPGEHEALSFWNLFFLMLIFIPLVMIWAFALIDLFRRPDLSGLAKALWVIAILLLPLLGMLIYFITRQPLPEEEEAMQRYRQAVAGTDVADQLERLTDLHQRGAISDDDLARAKAKVLGS